MTASQLVYRLGTARLQLEQAWKQRSSRLRSPFFSPERELKRIDRRVRRAADDPSFALEVYETHQPVLLALLESIQLPRVLELGTGLGSTPIVLTKSGSSLSLETDPVWHRRFAGYASGRHRVELWRDLDEREWHCPYLHESWDVAFVDNSPAGSRQSNLMKLAEGTRFVVCHDTEECFRPAASNYGWDFSSFRYVWTYARFGTYTTVVSRKEPIPLGESLTGFDGLQIPAGIGAV